MLGFGGAATHRCDTRLLTLWYSKVVGVCSLSARARHMGARVVETWRTRTLRGSSERRRRCGPVVQNKTQGPRREFQTLWGTVGELEPAERGAFRACVVTCFQ